MIRHLCIERPGGIWPVTVVVQASAVHVRTGMCVLKEVGTLFLPRAPLRTG